MSNAVDNNWNSYGECSHGIALLRHCDLCEKEVDSFERLRTQRAEATWIILMAVANPRFFTPETEQKWEARRAQWINEWLQENP